LLNLNNKLISSILIPVSTIFFITLGVITWLWIDSEVAALDAENKRYTAAYIEARKTEVRNEVLRVRSIIQDERQQAEIRLQQQLKERVNQAYTVIEGLHKRYSGTLTSSQIQQEALESLRFQRWENGQRYFYVVTRSGIELLYPPDPSKENRPVQDGFGDIGRRVFQSIRQVVDNHNEGVVSYMWQTGASDAPLEHKLSYVRLYQPWDWVIGTGSRSNDFEQSVRQQIYQKVAQIRHVRDQKGYFFLISYDGNIHTSRHHVFSDAPNILDSTNSKGVPVIRKNIDVARQQPGGGFSRYNWPDEAGRETEKLSFVLALDDMNLILGTGISLDAMKAEIASREARLQAKLTDRIQSLLLIIAISLIAVITAIYWLVLKLRANMQLFQQTFTDSINSRVHIDVRNVYFEEFKLLAHQANTMIDGLNLQAEELRHRAYHDHLTGLPNRMFGTRYLSEAIEKARAQQQHVSLLFIDLDNFKEVNDTQGHSAGDLLLKMVASRLQSLVQQGDLVARLGGDEFTIISQALPSSQRQIRLAEQVLEVFQQPFTLNEQQTWVTASIGLSSYPENGNSAELLLRNADAAMYRAKGDGKNGYSLYDSTMTDEVATRVATIEALREAIEQKQFMLYYQPRIETGSGQVIGAEALIRWHHPERGLVPPDQFIPFAEASGQIIALGSWVLEEACRQFVRWQQAGMELPCISVNISGHQLREADFVDQLAATLARTGCPASAIELEITESVLMDSTHRNCHTLQAIRDLGCPIAIDDFGTGYSSLSYLKRLPIDTLKIDRSFILEVHKDGHDKAITSAIIALAQSLKLEVVAEGVEGVEHIEMLRALGCFQVQGYHFCRPLPVPDFEHYLESASAVVSLDEPMLEYDSADA